MRGWEKRTRWRFWWDSHGDGRRRSKKSLLRLARAFSLSRRKLDPAMAVILGGLAQRWAASKRRSQPKKDLVAMAKETERKFLVVGKRLAQALEPGQGDPASLFGADRHDIPSRAHRWEV